MAPPLYPKMVSTPSSASTWMIASAPIIELPASGCGSAPSVRGLREGFTNVGICSTFPDLGFRQSCTNRRFCNGLGTAFSDRG
jgi:hypothetical protein